MNSPYSISEKEFPVLLEEMSHNHSKQTSICLDRVYITFHHIEQLAQALEKNSTLASLLIHSDILNTRAVTALAKALEKNSTLAVMQLIVSSLCDTVAKAFAEMLEKNTSLTSLHLHGIYGSSSISNEGSKAIAKALGENNSLTFIDITIANSSNINESILAFAEMLEKNTSLTSLHLHSNSFNSIGNEGSKAIAKALEKNSTLTVIELQVGLMNNAVIKAFAKMLEKNITLTSITLESVDECILAKMLEKNTTLTSIELKRTDGSDLNAALNRNKKISALAHPALEALQRILAIHECPNTKEESNEIAKQYLNIEETLKEIKQLHPTATQLDQIQEARIAIAAKHPWLIEPETAFELFEELNGWQKLSDKNQSSLEIIALSYYAEITKETDYSYSKLLHFMSNNWLWRSNNNEQIKHLLYQCLYRYINGKGMQSASLAIEPTFMLETLVIHQDKLQNLLQKIPGVDALIEDIIHDVEERDSIESRASIALVSKEIYNFTREIHELFSLIIQISNYSKILDKKSSEIAKDKAKALTEIVSTCQAPHRVPNLNHILDLIHQHKETIRQHRHPSAFSCFFPLFKSKLENRVTSYKLVSDLEKYIEGIQAKQFLQPGMK